MNRVKKWECEGCRWRENKYLSSACNGSPKRLGCYRLPRKTPTRYESNGLLFVFEEIPL